MHPPPYSPLALTPPVEICLVTPSLPETLARLQTLGIGPFKTYLFTPHATPTSPATITNTFYRGHHGASFALKVAFAQQGSMTWEVMQPVSGGSVMAEFLERNGGVEGVQHVAFDFAAGGGDGGDAGMGVEGLVGELGDRTFKSEEERKAAVEAERRMREFGRRGWECVMRGTWLGRKGTCEFTFFEMRKEDGSGREDGERIVQVETQGTCFETIVWSEDWEDPEEAVF